MTDEEMNLLNNDPKVKAFISFTKGEGFGRPLLEAAITGKPIITTNWSGHIDFLKSDYNILIGGKLNQIHKSASNQWLVENSEWFNLDIDTELPFIAALIFCLTLFSFLINHMSAGFQLSFFEILNLSLIKLEI